MKKVFFIGILVGLCVSSTLSFADLSRSESLESSSSSLARPSNKGQLEKALLIGISNYKNIFQASPTDASKNDIHVIANLLTLRGVVTHQFEEIELSELSVFSENTSNFLVHFSGFAVCDQDGVLLLPASATSESIRDSGVHLSRLLDSVRKDKSQHIAVILDTGLTFVDKKTKNCSPLKGISGILNTSILFPSLPGESGLLTTMGPGQMGALSATLANVLIEHTDEISTGFLFGQVVKEINKFSKPGLKQTPWVLDAQLGSLTFPAASIVNMWSGSSDLENSVAR